MLSNFYVLLLLILPCIAIIFFAGDKLIYFAEQLSNLTKISGAFIGLLLIAAITSVPEMISTFISVDQGLYALATGGIFGSNIVNLAILSFICLLQHKKNPYIVHDALFSFVFSMILLVIVGFLIVSSSLKEMHFDQYIVSFIVLGIYLFAMSYNFHLQQNKDEQSTDTIIEKPSQLSLFQVISGFILFSLVLILISWFLVFVCDKLSVTPIPLNGMILGEEFIGALILAFVTSIPEFATTYQIIKNGNISMAIENISGSNLFNLLVLVLSGFIAKEYIWASVPTNSLFTIFAILLASLLICLLALIKRNKKIAVIIYSLIIMIWITSLRLIF